ncbi:hypothetical protein [Rhizobium etli]|nr:hypothetical protein [Rhizobium etli]
MTSAILRHHLEDIFEQDRRRGAGVDVVDAAQRVLQRLAYISKA